MVRLCATLAHLLRARLIYIRQIFILSYGSTLFYPFPHLCYYYYTRSEQSPDQPSAGHALRLWFRTYRREVTHLDNASHANAKFSSAECPR